MQEDLLIVLLCELGERIVAMRELLAEPSVATKPHARAVAALLAEGLAAVEERLQGDVAAALSGGALSASTHTESLVMSALDDCGRALRVLHRRLGLLDLRWSAAPVDVFLRKLREDVGDLPHPAVVLSDEYDAPDEDVAARLRAELGEAGVPAPTGRPEAPLIALPRLDVSNPLAWPLLLPALVRLHMQRNGALDHVHGEMAQALESAGAARLGGPAAFAARAAHALITTPVEQRVWPAVAALSVMAGLHAGGLEEDDEGSGREQNLDGGFSFAGAIAFFTRLVQRRDEMLGHDVAWRIHTVSDEDADALGLPAAALPTAAETGSLVSKLMAGTPINAIEPPQPPDFVTRLDAVSDPAGLYALLEPLGERPASLAAILGAGWLYKIGHGYPLFRDLLRSEGSLHAALTAYRPHMVERDELLLQSIEAAHVQGIFLQGRIDG